MGFTTDTIHATLLLKLTIAQWGSNVIVPLRSRWNRTIVTSMGAGAQTTMMHHQVEIAFACRRRRPRSQKLPEVGRAEDALSVACVRTRVVEFAPSVVSHMHR